MNEFNADKCLRVPAPFFEVGPKNYLFGSDVLDLARAADEIAGKHEVTVFFTAPYVNISEIARIAKNIRVCAPPYGSRACWKGARQCSPGIGSGGGSDGRHA